MFEITALLGEYHGNILFSIIFFLKISIILQTIKTRRTTNIGRNQNMLS